MSDVDMDYVKALSDVMDEEGFQVLGKDVSDPVIAEEIYKVHMYLKNPVENLLSRIGGLLFMKEDTVSGMERRRDVNDLDQPVELSRDEKNKLRRYKEDISILKDCRDMIIELRKEKTNA